MNDKLSFTEVLWNELEALAAALRAEFRVVACNTRGLDVSYPDVQSLKDRVRILHDLNARHTYASRLFGSPLPLKFCSWP